MDESNTVEHESVELIVEGLMVGGSKIPVEAIEAARRHRVEITPLLIRVIEEAARDCKQGNSVDTNGHFFGTYLLAEFQATEAWPAVREAISLPGEKPYELYEDAITEDFGYIIATLIGDRPGEIDALLGNSEIDEFVRWQAVEALKFQVQSGLVTRDAAIELLASHLQRAVDNRERVLEGLVHGLEDLGAKSYLPLIEEAFAHNLVEPEITTLDHIKQNILRGDEIFHESMERLRKPEELIAHFERWAAEDEWASEDEFWEDPSEEYSRDPFFDDLQLVDHGTTIRYDSKKVGRNEKCPCGSGKKFKKCCGQH